MLRAYFRTDKEPAIDEQLKLADHAGVAVNARYTDTPKSFPVQRDALKRSMRKGDEYWTATTEIAKFLPSLKRKK